VDLPSGVRATQRARAGYALAFVLLSLVALLVIPLVLQRRIDALRAEIAEVAQPARILVVRVEVTAAWEAAALRGYLLSGDRDFLDTYVRAREAELRSFAELRPLVRRLGSVPTELYLEMRELSPQWHAGPTALFEGRISREEFARNLRAQQELYARMTAAALRLDAEIHRQISRRTAAIRRIERLGLVLNGALVLVALASAGVVARLVHAQRLLAARLEARAAEEAALRRAARDLTEPLAVPELLRRVVSNAIANGAADAAYVERIDPRHEEVEVAASEGAGAPALGVRVAYPGSLTEEMILGGTPELVPDLAARQGMAHARGCAGCSALLLPLVSEGEPLGALVLLRHARRPPFTAGEVARAGVFGDLAALALRRVLLYRDAEQRRDVAVELADRLRQQIDSKSRLMRGISHDVKNPLGAVLGYAELLEEGVYGDLTPTQRHSIARMRASIRSALRLIEDVLELARADEGGLAVVRRPVDAAAVLGEAVEAHRGWARQAGHQIDLDVPPGLPVLHTDATRLQQILGNLLSNAIKYVPSGGHIRVEAERVSGRRFHDPREWLSIRVADDGDGIPPEEQDRVFDEFSRLESNAAAGTGLGLAISRRIARLLGGDLSLESGPGGGCTFTVRLPLAPDGEGPAD
jgi:signal transduction histidine kinase